MSEYPGVIDGEILEEMKNLEMIIEFHKKVLESDKTVETFIPKEIRSLVDGDSAKIHWDNQNYDSIRLMYARVWILYYENIFGDTTHYSLEYFSERYKIS